MSDLQFTGGLFGIYVGNQQFTVSNLKFFNQLGSAIQIHWDWGWTWKGVEITNAPVTIIMSTPLDATEVGSAIFIDSKIINCPIGFQLQASQPTAAVSLSLFNLQTTNVPTIVEYDGGATLLTGSGGATIVVAWGLGKRYDTQNAETSVVWQGGANFPHIPNINSSLLSGGSQTAGFFQRSKPH